MGRKLVKKNKATDLETVVTKEKTVVVIRKKKAHMKETKVIETVTGKIDTFVIKSATGKVNSQAVSMMMKKKERIFMEDGTRRNFMKKKKMTKNFKVMIKSNSTKSKILHPNKIKMLIKLQKLTVKLPKKMLYKPQIP